MNLLEKLANPDLLEKMTTSEKINASFQTTIVGMSITFGALIIIWILCIILQKIVEGVNNENQSIKTVKREKKVKKEIVEIEEESDNSDELVAVISAAIAASLGKSTDSIIVKKIVRVDDNTPTWGQVARINQVNSKL